MVRFTDYHQSEGMKIKFAKMGVSKVKKRSYKTEWFLKPCSRFDKATKWNIYMLRPFQMGLGISTGRGVENDGCVNVVGSPEHL